MSTELMWRVASVTDGTIVDTVTHRGEEIRTAVPMVEVSLVHDEHALHGSLTLRFVGLEAAAKKAEFPVDGYVPMTLGSLAPVAMEVAAA